MKKCLPAAFSILFYLGAQAQFTKIFDFDSIPSGSAPVGHLASDGTYFYGTTYAGGANGLGVIYKIKPDGTGYVKLSDFNGAGNGSHPGIDSGPFFDGTYLYGTTIDGGTYNDGVIYRIRPDGTGDTVLYHFDGTLGKTIYCTLISDGTYLYGVASKGGLNTYGSIFKIKPDGTAMTKIFDFAGISNGSNTSASLIYDGTYLYGVTAGGGTGTGCVQGCGVLYKIKTDGSSFSTLINFSKNPDGDDLESQLVFDGTFLYGQTQDGGANNVGTLFKIKTDGTSYTKLYDFSPISGQTPTGLVSDGTYLYGTTYQNGGGSGTLYRIKPDGTGFLKLRAFGPSDGGYPLCNLVYD
ncbi:MAG: choice-of-anchor tandem repeat GloVer-containing protein, partial [Bacteroidia bacterium]